MSAKMALRRFALQAVFTWMSTPVDERSEPHRAIPYFNGGLFTDAISLSLDTAVLRALTKAAEANWTYVDPHIFGSVFQGVMDDAERHASGAHYTAREDIMSVVGPTIVEPWRERIEAANKLADLKVILKDLNSYRVLDPACGSGNFLYVAFRELYRLETEVLVRIYDAFPSATKGKGRVSWASGIRTTNFFGIDINPFAVELAKTTLNIAKKIAFDQRKEEVIAKFGQFSIDVDPSLPLDNLDENIVCDDALFCEWPRVDAVVGNPPFLGDRKIRGELGPIYLARLKKTPGVSGVVDLCCYWFRRAHDHLEEGGRAGLVATSGVRIGKARAASLDYIVDNKGTITHAVSSRQWPGDAVVHVSMINWTKGHVPGPHRLVLDTVHERGTIHPHLRLHADVRKARALNSNAAGTTMGVIFGSEAFRIASNDSCWKDGAARRHIKPVVTGNAMLRGKLTSSPDFCIDLRPYDTEAASRAGGAAYTLLKERVLPEIREKGESYRGWEQRWWQPWRPRTDFMNLLEGSARMIMCSNPMARPIFAFVSCAFVPTNTLQVFAPSDDYSFGIIQSWLHWRWTCVKGGRVKADIRYTKDVWETFPWPQEPALDDVVAVAQAARALRATRDRLVDENGWSLRDLYRAAEVEGPHPLKEAQAALDAAVEAAYGKPGDQEATEFLLEMNLALAEDEADGETIQGPGLPRVDGEELDPKDPRWFSTDCIEPPPLPGSGEDAGGAGG